ncbi:MAG: hypothetical protein WCB11_30735 [Terriglobales bacterium]
MRVSPNHDNLLWTARKAARIHVVMAVLEESSAANCPMATTNKYVEPSLAGCHRVVE